MEKYRIPSYYLIVAALFGGLTSFVIFHQPIDKDASLVASIATQPSAVSNCAYTIARIPGYKFIKPLLSSEPDCEAPKLEGIKSAITNLIESFKGQGTITSASVYLRQFGHGEWTVVNEAESFDPGSMLKVPILITYLHMAESDPTLMDKKFTAMNVDGAGKTPNFPSESLMAGGSYTVRQMLEFMIAHSDNVSTMTLTRHMIPGVFVKVFTDLGLPSPKMSDKQYRMTARNYSVFMKALFNSAYLGPETSEQAMDLLSRSDFNQGILAGLPLNTPVVHKFGEAGDPAEKQLHETAIVYVNDAPYLITIMTKGPDMMKLPEVLSSISKLVYENLAGTSGPVPASAAL